MKNIPSVPSISSPKPVNEKVRLPLAIPVHAYLKDHCFYGKIILPAVEILQHLAASLQSCRPDAPVRSMRSASFDRFLQMDPDSEVINACHELEANDAGGYSSKLMMTTAIAGTTMKRTKVHAMVDFTNPEMAGAPLPMDLASALEGPCLEISAEALYGELVPFGPAYRNVTGSLFLSESGAIGQVSGADHPSLQAPLGSPFPFDAALHAACAWGQRFRQIVAFPVGFEKRMIWEPTKPGELYHCRIMPVSSTRHVLRFDIWIHDLKGILHEEIRGVAMKDISDGRIRPPEWVLGKGAVTLPNIREHCRAFSIVEMRTIGDFADKALSQSERERFEKMGSKRQKSYLAGRLALKYLSRKLPGGDGVRPASNIHTAMPDGIHPCCPAPFGEVSPACSVSHDSRFAIAIAGDEAIGVDVEKVSERVLKARHIFMSKDEAALADTCAMGAIQASLRVWSIKEGVSKATGRHLAASWKAAKVDHLGEERSKLTVDGIPYMAVHDTIDDHVFTLVKKEKKP